MTEFVVNVDVIIEADDEEMASQVAGNVGRALMSHPCIIEARVGEMEEL